MKRLQPIKSLAPTLFVAVILCSYSSTALSQLPDKPYSNTPSFALPAPAITILATPTPTKTPEPRGSGENQTNDTCAEHNLPTEDGQDWIADLENSGFEIDGIPTKTCFVKYCDETRKNDHGEPLVTFNYDVTAGTCMCKFIRIDDGFSADLKPLKMIDCFDPNDLLIAPIYQYEHKVEQEQKRKTGF